MTASGTANAREPVCEKTGSGTAFATLRRHGGKPAPTLLLFASTAADALLTEPYCRVGRLLHERGWNIVSLDLPCHGDDRRAGEPEELEGWAARVRLGEDISASFRARVNDVVAHLVANGITDPDRIAAAGTSRGGFMAFHAAAGSPRIHAVAAFAPVTDLIALSEFSGQSDNPLVRRLALLNAVDRLAGRSVWIIIGNSDDRVDTGKAVAFAESLSSAGTQPGSRDKVTLCLTTTPGHASFPEWHDQAAKWFLKEGARHE